MAIKLVIDAKGEHGPKEQELDQSLITFGRSKSCHIELNHPEMSRRHFIIKFIDDQYVLVDEGSRHGTYVDAEKIESHQPYVLKNKNLILVPGFSINIFWDGQKPKLERTTVVARKLLDELLQGSIVPRECPSLCSKSGDYRFKFVEEKSTFVLGSLQGGDFVVHDEKIAKKHLSFARDINGIRAIPVVGNVVLLNGEVTHDPVILNHGAVITVGGIEFIYNETESIAVAASTEHEAEKEQGDKKEVEEVSNPSVIKSAPKKNSFWRALDRAFLLAFIVAIAYASVVFFEFI